ncbi:MAG: hypothetical protein MMC33_001202 [Icmadophila ericetorum]|nr:hypothetical protein [Icmadophila ericetorum]
MDYTLRCNSLRCRKQLTERAVVTTCSHIFCIPCSDELGLSAPKGPQRLCPACQAVLANPDDAVSTQLNPSEDYKTSVLSGLSPAAIMECAGRGLAFWSYQSTQEIVYQEYLAKTLTDKYGHLSLQMDKVINEANAEIESLSQKISAMQIEQDQLKAENINLANIYREKNKKHQHTQELYDRLKRKEMTAVTQSAAYDSANEVLESATRRQSHGRTDPSLNGVHTRSETGGAAPYGPSNSLNREPHYGMQRGINDSKSSNTRMMPPPAPLQHQDRGNQAFATRIDINGTPSLHRTRLIPAQSRGNPQVNGIGSHNLGTFTASNLHGQTPLQRRPLSNLVSASNSRSGLSGYGMSAGLKVGRQHGSRSDT